jgi:lysophospholipase L1-like esterase
VKPLRFGAVVLLLLGSMAASLPEDTGAAVASAPPGSPVRPDRVVSLGDSVPTGAECDCSPFPVLVAADLAAPGQRVGVDQLAEDGATSGDVAATVEENLDDLSPSDVVLLEAGANDLADLADDGQQLPTPAEVDSAAAQAVATVSATVDRILPTGARVVVLDYWAVGLDGEVAATRYTPAERAVQDELTDSFDDQLRAAVDAKGGRVGFVGLRPVFHGSTGGEDPTPLLADDGDHPNAQGQRAIADAVLAELASEHATRSPNIR